ncbi:MAG: TatD family hydrolase, partial [Bacteroidales bacterium]|nr:TatD family hydrolase [Bacteroidales bacterium]
MNPYVNIHTHYNNHIGNNEFVEIQNIDVDNIVNVDVSHFYSIGIHPWNLKSQNLKISETQKLGDLESQCLGDLNIKAIGECGLDRACDVDFEIQKEVFIKQIELSEQIAKPLIIHAVRTYPDIISIRKEIPQAEPRCTRLY